MALKRASTRVHGRRVLVLVLPNVHALDFGGPVQTVAEANGFGAEYRLTYVGKSRKVRTAQGFAIADLEPPLGRRIAGRVLQSQRWFRIPSLPVRFRSRVRRREARISGDQLQR